MVTGGWLIVMRGYLVSTSMIPHRGVAQGVQKPTNRLRCLCAGCENRPSAWSVAVTSDLRLTTLARPVLLNGCPALTFDSPFPLQKHSRPTLRVVLVVFVRDARIELASVAWEATVLPLNESRSIKKCTREYAASPPFQTHVPGRRGRSDGHFDRIDDDDEPFALLCHRVALTQCGFASAVGREIVDGRF